MVMSRAWPCTFPRSRDPREQMRLSTAITNLHDFAQHVLSSLPSRTTPIVASDVKDDVGLAPCRHGDAEVKSRAVGPHGRISERRAGTLMREMAESFGLAVANTWYSGGPLRGEFGQQGRPLCLQGAPVQECPAEHV